MKRYSDTPRFRERSKATYFEGKRSRPGAFVQCQARTKSTGERCKRKALMDKTVCRNHGGLSGRPKEWGRYGKYADQTIKEKLNELYADEEYKDMREELALLRSIVAEQIEQADEETKDGKRKGVNVYRVTEAMREIRQTIQLMEDVEHKKQYNVSVKSIERLIYGLTKILAKYVTDVGTLVAIQREIQTIVIDPTSERGAIADGGEEGARVGRGAGKARPDMVLQGSPGVPGSK